MNSKKGFFTGIIVFAVLMLAAVFLYANLSSGFDKQNANSGNMGTAESKVERRIAPDFTVLDADGNTVSLSDFAGKPVVVNFWASWCGPCKEEMPDFDDMYKEMGDEVVFMMVNKTDNKTETIEVATEFVQSNGYNFPLYFDTHQSAATAYAITGIPATYLVDREGKIAYQKIGVISKAELREAIALIYSPGEEAPSLASPVAAIFVPSSIISTHFLSKKTFY